MSIHDAIRKHMTRDVIIDPAGHAKEMHTARKRASEILDPAVIDLMRQRLLIGHFRYGRRNFNMRQNIGVIKRKLSHYEETRNLEMILDAAAVCLVELERGKRAGYDFISLDDGGH